MCVWGTTAGGDKSFPLGKFPPREQETLLDCERAGEVRGQRNREEVLNKQERLSNENCVLKTIKQDQ